MTTTFNAKQLIPVSQLSHHIWNTRFSYQRCPIAAGKYLYPIVKEQELTAQEIKEEMYEFNYHQ